MPGATADIGERSGRSRLASGLDDPPGDAGPLIEALAATAAAQTREDGRTLGVREIELG